MKRFTLVAQIPFMATGYAVTVFLLAGLHYANYQFEICSSLGVHSVSIVFALLAFVAFLKTKAMLHVKEVAPLVFFAIFSISASIMASLAAKDLYIINQGEKTQGVIIFQGEREHYRRPVDRSIKPIKPLGITIRTNKHVAKEKLSLQYEDNSGVICTTPYKSSFGRQHGEKVQLYYIPNREGFVLDADCKEILMPFLWLLLVSSAAYAGAFGMAYYNKSLREEEEYS